MGKLIAIGEALIDFAPMQTGVPVKEVSQFAPKVGGAPANVCGAFVKLGGEADLITQLGRDPFGDKILDEFQSFGIGTEYIERTEQANTSLAFVATKEDGDREFSFYRNPGADMLLSPDKIQKDWFSDVFALHFCSVSLGDFPMKDSHDRAIEYAKSQGAIISFDPNVRLPLWKDHKLLQERIIQYGKQADILKISDEELSFITGKVKIEDALPQLLCGDVKLVIFTRGADGAMAFTHSASAEAVGRKVQALDTTGAGDGFIGSFLYQLYRDGVNRETLSTIGSNQLEKYLKASANFCSTSVEQQGAIASYPTCL